MAAWGGGTPRPITKARGRETSGTSQAGGRAAVWGPVGTSVPTRMPRVPTRLLPAPRARGEHRGADTLLVREALSKRLSGRALPAGQSSALVGTRAR